MTVAAFLASVEAWFTFEAQIPPHRLRQLSLRQIRSHLLWWEANRGPLEWGKTSGR